MADNETFVCNKAELEEMVCKYIKSKQLSKDQLTKIYFLLQDDIIENCIPDNEYWKNEKKLTFDFSIKLDNVSVNALISILDIAGYK